MSATRGTFKAGEASEPDINKFQVALTQAVTIRMEKVVQE